MLDHQAHGLTNKQEAIHYSTKLQHQWQSLLCCA